MTKKEKEREEWILWGEKKTEDLWFKNKKKKGETCEKKTGKVIKVKVTSRDLTTLNNR